jgi:hypothetical protein
LILLMEEWGDAVAEVKLKLWFSYTGRVGGVHRALHLCA